MYSAYARMSLCMLLSSMSFMFVSVCVRIVHFSPADFQRQILQFNMYFIGTHKLITRIDTDNAIVPLAGRHLCVCVYVWLKCVVSFHFAFFPHFFFMVDVYFMQKLFSTVLCFYFIMFVFFCYNERIYIFN